MIGITTWKARTMIGLLSAAGGLTTGIVAGAGNAVAQPMPEPVQRVGVTSQPSCNGPTIDNNWHEGPRAQVACTGVVYRISATYCQVHCVTEAGPWRTNYEWSTLIFPHGGTITAAEVQVH